MLERLFIPSLDAFKTWLMQNKRPDAVLIDPHWDNLNETLALLGRLNVDVTTFRDFTQSSQWLDSTLAELHTEPDEDVPLTAAKLETSEHTAPYTSNSKEVFLSEREEYLVAEMTQSDVGQTESLEEDSLETKTDKVSSRLSPNNRFLHRTVKAPTLLLKPEEISSSSPSANTDTNLTAFDTILPESKPDVLLETLPDNPVSEKIYVERPVYVQQNSIQALRPRLVVVVGLTPSSGVTFLSMSLAHLLGTYLPAGNVSLIEHPNQQPRFWYHFRLDEKAQQAQENKSSPYVSFFRNHVHWLQDGRGSTLQLDSVDLVPMAPELSPSMYSEEKMFTYVYRELRRPFVIVDAGQHLDDSMLLESADEILLLVNADPTLIFNPVFAERFRTFLEQYPNAISILNRWSRHVGSDVQRAISPKGIFIPHISDDALQRALWNGVFPTEEPVVRDALQAIETQFVHKWVPPDLRAHEGKKSKFRLWRRNRDE